MRPVILSERMCTVAQMVTSGNTVCDVGCDHGFVPIYLVQHGISPRVLAMDLREGPLGAARGHVAAYGLQGQIETRLSDGLHNYKNGETDTLICAGMGGGLIRRILEQEREKALSFQEMVLQPQSEIEQFRRFLREEGYSILEEKILEEDGKFYQIIKAVPGHGEVSLKGSPFPYETEKELCKLTDKYGPILMQERTPVFLSFLDREAAVYKKILEELSKQGFGDERRRKRYVQVEALLRENSLVRAMTQKFT